MICHGIVWKEDDAGSYSDGSENLSRVGYLCVRNEQFAHIKKAVEFAAEVLKTAGL